MKTVESDADLPECLNTETKQKRQAKRIAEICANGNDRAVQVTRVLIQGFFSRTLIVTMASGRKRVIQFRVEPINLEDFYSARRLLGDVVPDIESITDATMNEVEIHPYAMSLVPGMTWIEAPNARRDHVKILYSLGKALSGGLVATDSTTVVEQVIVPKLKALQDSTDVRIEPFKTNITALIKSAGTLKSLPLFISHPDLNQVNILVGESGEVSGIVDWEGSSQLPFGMGFCRIHELAGMYINGNFHMPQDFAAAETSFWEAVFNGVPDHIHESLRCNMGAVQTCVKIGNVLENLDSEHGFNKAAIKALPMFLTYRLPALRGKHEPPYLESL
ncbi:hypothetical protein FGB62_36g121 [Gracilaria domingensis]|nr:hypothetical protein FGB62_36g121 [Gracilaria domingensis]